MPLPQDTRFDQILRKDGFYISAFIAGTNAANTPTIFEIYRDATNGGDTLAVDAQLLGVEIIFN